MIINGKVVKTEEELELAIKDMDKDSQIAMRAIFAGKEPPVIAPEILALSQPKIYDIVRAELKFKHFHEIDYVVDVIQDLFPKRTMVRGEVQKVDWYLDVACTNKVLSVEIVYVRDAMGFALSRTTTRTWINRDNTENPSKKVTTKVYTINNIEQVSEGIRRRGNIVTGLQMPTLGMMLATIHDGKTQAEILQMGRDFLKHHKPSLDAFRDESHKQIQADITNATDYWLNNVIAANGTTIRMYILNELNI